LKEMVLAGDINVVITYKTKAGFALKQSEEKVSFGGWLWVEERVVSSNHSFFRRGGFFF